MRQSSSSTASSFFSSQANSAYPSPPAPPSFSSHQHHPSTTSSTQPSRPSSFRSFNQQTNGPIGLPLLPSPRKFECIEPDLDPRSTFGETTYVYSFLPPGHVSSLVPASSGSVAEAEAEAAATTVIDSIPSSSTAQRTNGNQSFGSDEDDHEKDSDMSDNESGHGSRNQNAQSIECGQDGGHTPEDLARRLGDGSQIEIKHRRRTSRLQFNTLEETFLTNPKPTGTQRKELGSKLDMSPRAVQVWFQNRRAKVKNQAKKAAELQVKGLFLPLLRETLFPPPPPPPPSSSSYSIHPTESLAGWSGKLAVGPSPNEIVQKHPRSRHPSEADAYSLTSARTSIDGNSPSTPGSMLLGRTDLSSNSTIGGSLANTYRQHNGASPQLTSSSSSSSSSIGASGAHIGSIYSSSMDPRNSLGINRRQSVPSYESTDNLIGRQEEALAGSILGLLKAGRTTQADTYRNSAEEDRSFGEDKSSGGSAATLDRTATGPSSVDRICRPESGQLWNGLYPVTPTGLSSQTRQSEQSGMLPPPVPVGSHRRPSVGSSSTIMTTTAMRHAPYNPSLSSRRASVPANSTSASASVPTSAPASTSFLPPVSTTGKMSWNLTPIEDHERAEVYTQIPPVPPPLSDFSQPPRPPPPSQVDPSYTFDPELYSIPTHQPHSYQQAQHLFQPLPMQRSQQPQHYLHHQQQQLYQQYQQQQQQQQQQADSSYAFQSSSVTPVPQFQQQQQQQQHLSSRPLESLPNSSLLFGSTTEMGRAVHPSEARVDGMGPQRLDGPRSSDSIQGSGMNFGYQEHALEIQPSTELTNDTWHHAQGNQFARRESAPAQFLDDFSSMSVLAMQDGNASYLQDYSSVGNPTQGTAAQSLSITAAAPFSYMQNPATGPVNQNSTPNSQLQLQQQRDDMNQGLSNEHISSLRSYQHPLPHSQAPGSEQETDFSSGGYIRMNEDGYPGYSDLQRMSTLAPSDNSYIDSISPKQQQ